MAKSPEERLARIEETLKHIDEKLDNALLRQNQTEITLCTVREHLVEMRSTLKIQRMFLLIGITVAIGGAGALTKIFGLL